MGERKSQWELFLESEEQEAAPKEKWCTGCKRNHDRSAFGKDRANKDGLQYYCKEWRSKTRRKYRDDADRFWKTFNSHIERDDDGCLIWTGRLVGDGTGGGRPAYGKYQTLVRRIVYRLTVGDLPDDMFVFTTCGKPLCVNRYHLKLGTAVDREVLRANRAATGDRNGTNTCPDSRPRGDRNGRRLHPERYPRGEEHQNAKLTEADIRIIRQWAKDGVMGAHRLAKYFGVNKKTMQSIIKGKTWKHVQ